jgi:hypothetical protein
MQGEDRDRNAAASSDLILVLVGMIAGDRDPLRGSNACGFEKSPWRWFVLALCQRWLEFV